MKVKLAPQDLATKASYMKSGGPHMNLQRLKLFWSSFVIYSLPHTKQHQKHLAQNASYGSHDIPVIVLKILGISIILIIIIIISSCIGIYCF